MTKRMIHEALFTNTELNELEIEARYLYIATVIHADDEGRMRADPKILKLKAFPFDPCSVDKVRAWRDQLATKAGLIVVYEVDGKEYLYHPKWEKWQTLRKDRLKPTDCPDPCQPTVNQVATKRQPSAAEVREVREVTEPNRSKNSALPRNVNQVATNCQPVVGEDKRPYQKPDREKEPVRFLVYAYKVIKKFNPEDRDWDKQNFSRFAKAASEIFQVCKDWKTSVRCIEQLGKRFNEKGLDWHLGTIAKHAHEWKLKNEKGDSTNGTNDRQGVHHAMPEQHGHRNTPRQGGLTPAGKVLTGSRSLSSFLPESEDRRGAPRSADEVAS